MGRKLIHVGAVINFTGVADVVPQPRNVCGGLDYQRATHPHTGSANSHGRGVGNGPVGVVCPSSSCPWAAASSSQTFPSGPQQW